MTSVGSIHRVVVDTMVSFRQHFSYFSLITATESQYNWTLTVSHLPSDSSVGVPGDTVVTWFLPRSRNLEGRIYLPSFLIQVCNLEVARSKETFGDRLRDHLVISSEMNHVLAHAVDSVSS